MQVSLFTGVVTEFTTLGDRAVQLKITQRSLVRKNAKWLMQDKPPLPIICLDDQASWVRKNLRPGEKVTVLGEVSANDSGIIVIVANHLESLSSESG